jgi:hypothetical protein
MPYALNSTPAGGATHLVSPCSIECPTVPPPASHFDWARRVVDQLRGTHAQLEERFDAAYAMRP